jgi:phage shock protein E
MKRLVPVIALLAVACAAAPAPSPATPAEPVTPSVASPATSAEPSTPTAGAETKLTPCKAEDRISGKDAQTLVSAGATLVDVRSTQEFAEQHVEGARNIPVGDIESRMSELPKDHPVVVYCRSGMRAARAASALRAAGFTAYNMGGVDAWGHTDC